MKTITLRVDPGLGAAAALASIKAVAGDHPGEHQLAVKVGNRRLTLGWFWTYDASPECLSALGEFGDVENADDLAGPGPRAGVQSLRPDGGTG